MLSADYRALIKQAEQAVTAVNDPEFKRATQLSDLGSAEMETFQKRQNMSAEAEGDWPSIGAGRYYHARREDIDAIQPGCRVVIQAFLHHAKLL